MHCICTCAVAGMCKVEELEARCGGSIVFSWVCLSEASLLFQMLAMDYAGSPKYLSRKTFGIARGKRNLQEKCTLWHPTNKCESTEDKLC